MKLYFSRGACSLAVRIILNELHIPCEYEAVNLKTKQTESGADFYKINPKGAVPVLEFDDKSILTENAAIQQYLADSKKADLLLPPVDQMPRYHVIEWLNFVATDLHKGFGPFFNPAIPNSVKDEVFRPTLINKLKLVEQQLTKNKFLTGDHFTLPDAYLCVILNWLPTAEIDINNFPMTTTYFAALKQRESVMKSFKEEGLLREKT